MRTLPVASLAALALTTGCFMMVPRQTAPATTGDPAYADASGGHAGADGADGYSAPAYSSTPAYGSAGTRGADGRAGSSAPAGPVTVSVTIRSSCKQTVPVFYGDKPKYGSGTTSSISSNSVSSKTFQEGDMIWVLDDSGNGAGSVTISGSTRNVEINSSCTGISAR